MFFIERISLSIYSTMMCWWAVCREAIDLAHQAQCHMDLQGRNREAIKKDNQWTKAVRRNIKGRKGRAKLCRAIKAQDIGTSRSPRKNGSLSKRPGRK